MTQLCPNSDLIVFSHVRWDDPFQRIHHLMTRYASHRRIYFVERPQIIEHLQPFMDFQQRTNIRLLTPHLPMEFSTTQRTQICRNLIDDVINEEKIENFSLWYNDPLAIKFTDHLIPSLTIYDGFHHKSSEHSELERRLVNKADLVLAESSPKKAPSSLNKKNLVQYLLDSEEKERAHNISWDQSWACVAELEKNALAIKAKRAQRHLNCNI